MRQQLVPVNSPLRCPPLNGAVNLLKQMGITQKINNFDKVIPNYCLESLPFFIGLATFLPLSPTKGWV
ncbi:tsl2226 [Thermosynechococcus vestitus BP-1]|uniref:Tsl2226 protein n=1 Tax=Thermosynechococcus vestitus (strain NIES-2133 / IAM M-273 / BP-1) TaxID=197221 RepID=Q8DGT7_THEVB|nr:tsl2226 [Thermosynechococcus vestitus BP-1]